MCWHAHIQEKSTHGISLTCQGYALVEYATHSDAKNAIEQANGSTLLDQVLECDFAFVRPPPSGPKKRASAGGRQGRGRSASPGR